MANLYPPNGKLNQPELFYPYRKPVGKVKIDWNNPLAATLERYYLFSENRDIVTGSPCTLTNSTTGQWSRDPDVGGLGAKNTSGGSGFDLVNFELPFHSHKTDVSYLFVLNHNQSVGTLDLFAGAYQIDGLRLRVDNLGSSYSIEYAGFEPGLKHSISLSVNFSREHIISFIVTMTEGEGKIIAPDTHAYTTPFSFALKPSNQLSLYGEWAKNIDGSMYVAARFGEVLSVVKAQKILENPYHLLIPDRG